MWNTQDTYSGWNLEKTRPVPTSCNYYNNGQCKNCIHCDYEHNGLCTQPYINKEQNGKESD